MKPCFSNCYVQENYFNQLILAKLFSNCNCNIIAAIYLLECKQCPHTYHVGQTINRRLILVQSNCPTCENLCEKLTQLHKRLYSICMSESGKHFKTRKWWPVAAQTASAKIIKFPNLDGIFLYIFGARWRSVPTVRFSSLSGGVVCSQ